MSVRADLTIICTDGGSHRQRMIRRLWLDPRGPEGFLRGVVTVATGQQRGGHPDPNAHAGENGKWRFRCPECRYDLPVSDRRLKAALEKLAAGPRVATVELRMLATVV